MFKRKDIFFQTSRAALRFGRDGEKRRSRSPKVQLLRLLLATVVLPQQQEIIWRRL
jgi:hypothetical protein